MFTISLYLDFLVNDSYTSTFITQYSTLPIVTLVIKIKICSLKLLKELHKPKYLYSIKILAY